MKMKLQKSKFVALWAEAREAHYESAFLFMQSQYYRSQDYNCNHPPLKKDGTHNKQFECKPCRDVAWNAYNKSIEIDNKWAGVWETFALLGVPVNSGGQA